MGVEKGASYQGKGACDALKIMIVIAKHMVITQNLNNLTQDMCLKWFIAVLYHQVTTLNDELNNIKKLQL